jgi:hypothetical protein
MRLTKIIDTEIQVMDISYRSIVVEELLQKQANTIVYSFHRSCGHEQHNEIKTITIQDIPLISRGQF